MSIKKSHLRFSENDLSLQIEEVACMADSVGERIKRLRQLRGLTMRQLADLAQVPQSTLSAVETGTRTGSKLTLETGKRLARALGVSLDVIAGVYEEEGSDFEPAAVALVGA
jgi:transcriptional regulator with XRE-family HTH domain